MSLKNICKNKNITLAIVILVIFLILGFFWINKLRVAHSTFQNYYNFRGCVSLIEKTDTYGICKLASGKIVKLVKFQNKWYLDGDLPYPGLNFL